MTLNLTVLSSDGIWQSSDHRLSAPRRIEDDVQKQVIIRGSDGCALVAYTHGPMKVLPGGHLAYWLSDVLRGSTGSIDSFLRLIQDEATAELPREPLIQFTVAARILDECWAIKIANRNHDGTESGGFVARFMRCTNLPTIIVSGYETAVTESDRARLREVVTNASRRPKDVAGALAALTSRVSARSASHGTISSNVSVLYSPPTIEPFREFHFDWSLTRQERQERVGQPVPFLLFGIDLTPITKIMSDPGSLSRSIQDAGAFLAETQAASRLGIRKTHHTKHRG